MQQQTLVRSVLILSLFFLCIAGLHFAKPFLVPFSIAGLLAMLFLPLSRWFERSGMNRALASVLCVLVFVLFIAGIISLLAWQIADFSKDMEKMQEHVGQIVSKAKEFISNTLGISAEKQQAMMKQQQQSGGSSAGKMVTGIMSGLGGILVDTILVLVYIFLLLCLRSHIKEFILRLVKEPARPVARTIISDSSKVAQKYLSGLGLMIAMLWVMYGIGFSIVGVKHAIFFAILCGILEIVPFIGNITGTALTLLMALSQGAGSGMLIGILATYAAVQFIQTYLLEPLVVGAKVKLNPLVTITGIVIAELIWGIPGMILAIPFMGIIKIICDHVESLKPYGFLLGDIKKKKEEKK